MKICVLNGSPKGADSVTMQYVKFLTLAYPGHTFIVENIGQRIGVIEAKEEEFRKVIASVSSADAVLFATPVYYLLVPSQFKRFFELVFSHNAAPDFLGKTAASLTTSIHFFDHTANEYLHAVAEDLGMRWAGSFMAKMDDLLMTKNQEDLVLFGADFLETAFKKPAIQRMYPPVRAPQYPYHPAGIPMPLETGDSQVVIVTDAAAGSNLEKMVTRFSSCFGRSASVVPLEVAKMKGGCLGCCRCAFENRCVYEDGFAEFWKNDVLAADIIVFAVTVKDRSFSAAFKQALDRSFFLGHVPQMAGKQVAFLFQGPYASCETLRQVVSAYPAVQRANLAGVVTDEDENSFAIDERIDALALRCLRLSHSGYVAPSGFPAVAGHKVFRDEIWATMRAIFRADDAYYRAHGLYDFPQHDYLHRIRTSFLSLVMVLPQARTCAKAEMKEHMIKPFAPVFTASPVLKRMKQEKSV